MMAAVLPMLMCILTPDSRRLRGPSRHTISRSTTTFLKHPSKVDGGARFRKRGKDFAKLFRSGGFARILGRDWSTEERDLSTAKRILRLWCLRGGERELPRSKEVRQALKEDPSIFDYDKYFDEKAEREGKLPESTREEQKMGYGEGKSLFIERAAILAEQRNIEQLIRRSHAEAENSKGFQERFVGKKYKRHLKRMRELRKQDAKYVAKNDQGEVRAIRNAQRRLGPLAALRGSKAVYGGDLDNLPDLSKAPEAWEKMEEEIGMDLRMAQNVEVSAEATTASSSSGATPEPEINVTRNQRVQRWVHWSPDNKNYLKQIDPNGPRTFQEMEFRYDKTAIAQMSRLDREAAKRKEKNRQQQEELRLEQQAKLEEEELVKKIQRMPDSENRTALEVQYEEIHRRARPILTLEEQEALRSGRGIFKAQKKKQEMLEGSRKKRVTESDIMKEFEKNREMLMEKRRSLKAKQRKSGLR